MKYMFTCWLRNCIFYKLRYWCRLRHIELSHLLKYTLLLLLFFFTSLFSSCGKHKKYSEKFWSPKIVFYVSLVSIVTYFKLTAIHTIWSFNLILEVASYTNSFLKISYSLFYSSFKWWSFFPTSDEVFSF